VSAAPAPSRGAAAIADASPSAAPICDEEYDGILELDNPQPRWFQLIFLASAIFAAGYWFWYHAGGPGEPHLVGYQRDYAAYRAHRTSIEVAEGAAVSEESLALLASDSAAMGRAAAVFTRSCASCHQADGRGLVGPNLTDDFQLHGASRSDLYHVVRNGVPDKGMVAWGPLLPPADVAAVSAFVSTLRHRNVAGGKAPQGAQVAPFARAK
jgi:cytochrome c oxidase cbb3-type subunit III